MNVPEPGTEVIAWVGLGSNLLDPVDQVSRALGTLAELPDCRDFRHSSLYRSAPMGPPDQPEYINAVCCFNTSISAENLLNKLQLIETRHDRTRGLERWGPRTLDLDLLFYGDHRQNDEYLTIPHPGIADRAFVLLPMLEILGAAVSSATVSVPSPDVSVPGFWLEQVGDLVARVAMLGGQGVEKLSKVDQFEWGGR